MTRTGLIEIVGFDTETFLITDGCICPAMVCGTFAGDDWQELLAPDESLNLFASYLETDAILVAHNVAYDLAVIIAHAYETLSEDEADALFSAVWRALREGRIADTMIREMLLGIASGRLAYEYDDEGDAHKREYNLEALARTYLGISLDKDPDGWRLRYGTLADVPIVSWPSRAIEYALGDAVAARAVYLKQGAGKVSPDEAEQCAAAFALHLCAVWGVRTDAAQLDKLNTELRAELETINATLQAADLLKFKRKRDVKAYEAGDLTLTEAGDRGMLSRDMKKIKAAVSAVYEAHGRTPPKTKTGDVSTSSETIEEAAELANALEDYDGTAIKVVSDKISTEKVLSTYLAPMSRGTDKPLNSSPNVLVATGRTSWRRPNLQNFPRKGDVRNAIIPRPGYVLVSCDYDSIELRCLAEACLSIVGWSTLAQRYIEDPDFDPHTNLAAQILGMSYEDAMHLKGEGDKRVKETRQIAKAANFGYPGGCGPVKFLKFAAGYGVTMTVAQSRKLKEDWLRAYPEMAEYFAHVSDLPGLNAKAAKITQIGSCRVRGGVSYCDGCNTYFQGLAADGAKAALVAASEAAYVDRSSPLYGSRPVVFVHDEIIAEVRIESAHEAAAELGRIMVAEMGKYVRRVPVRATPALMTRWLKDAEPKHDENGRLIPYA